MEIRCAACCRLCPGDQFSKSQLKKRDEWRRCRACVSANAPIDMATRRLNVSPLDKLVEKLFSNQDLEQFQEWHKSLDLRRDADIVDDVNVYEEILPKYEPLSVLCNQVDSETRLYPLQKAIRLGLEWHDGVKQIHEARDDIIGLPDPESGLTAFQLAASLEEASLGLSFHLLRAYPSAIHEKLFDPNEMTYSPDFFTGYTSSCTEAEKALIEAPIDWETAEYLYSDEDDCIDSDGEDDDKSLGD